MLHAAIAIRQPWAFLIVQACEPSERKDIENRSWALPAQFVGQPMLVVASASPKFRLSDVAAECDARNVRVQWLLDAVLGAPGIIPATLSGGIVGVVRFAASIRNDGQAPPSPWANTESRWWWPVLDARPLPFTPCRGQLSIFRREYAGGGMEGF